MTAVPIVFVAFVDVCTFINPIARKAGPAFTDLFVFVACAIRVTWWAAQQFFAVDTVFLELVAGIASADEITVCVFAVLVAGVGLTFVDVYAFTVGIHGEARLTFCLTEFFGKGVGNLFALCRGKASAPFEAFDVNALVTFTTAVVYGGIACLSQIGAQLFKATRKPDRHAEHEKTIPKFHPDSLHFIGSNNDR